MRTWACSCEAFHVSDRDPRPRTRAGGGRGGRARARARASLLIGGDGPSGEHGGKAEPNPSDRKHPRVRDHDPVYEARPDHLPAVRPMMPIPRPVCRKVLLRYSRSKGGMPPSSLEREYLNNTFLQTGLGI